MSPARKRLLIGLVIVVAGVTTAGLIYLRTINRGNKTIVYRPDGDEPARTLELKHRGRDWYLVDTERISRSNRKGRFLNPVMMSRAELTNQSEVRWGRDNEWLAFRSLYLDYYTPYYRKRFDVELHSTSEAIEHAYDYWKRHRTKESGTGGRRRRSTQ